MADDELQYWCSVINVTTFDILKLSRRFQTRQPRKLTLYIPGDDEEFALSDGRIVISHVERHKQEIIFLRDLRGVRLNSSDDRCLRVDFTDSTYDKGNQSLIFRNFADRQLFAHFIQLVTDAVTFSAENEWKSKPQPPKASTGVVHRAETVNSIGIKVEINVTLDYAARSLEFGTPSSTGAEDESTIMCAVDTASIQLHHGSANRLDLQYEDTNNTLDDLGTTGSGATGIGVLKKALAEKEVVSVVSKRKRIALTFKSVYARERFAARFRAIKQGVVPTGQPPAGASMVGTGSTTLSTGEMLRIFCGSFNTGDKPPPKTVTELDQWLKSGEFDIYVMSFQECSQATKWQKALKNLLCGKEASNKCDHRLKQERAAMGSSSNRVAGIGSGFVMFAKERLWDIHIMMVVRGDLAARLTDVTTTTEATGFAHILGNKGAAAIGVTLDHSTRLAFISSHLAARGTRIRKRQENYMEICNGMKKLRLFDGKDSVEWMHTYDHVFWMGDLNYRIDLGQPGTPEEFDKVLSLVRNQNLAHLQKADTLIYQMTTQASFVGFQEGPINFLPTYRMIKGAAGYNNKNNQNPSYTDRVLYRSAPGESKNLSLQWYEAAMGITLSDHRPIAAGFEFVPRQPFALQDGMHRVGAVDDCLIFLRSLTYIAVPEPSHAGLTEWQKSFSYDGSSAPLSFAVRHNESFLPHSVHSKRPVPCVNPDACSKIGGFTGLTSDAVERAIWEGAAPVWTSQDFMMLRPAVTDGQWLSQQYLTMTVSRTPNASSQKPTEQEWAKETNNSSSQDNAVTNLIAQVQVPLAESFATAVQALRESAAVGRASYVRGSVSGAGKFGGGADRLSSAGFAPMDGGDDDFGDDHASGDRMQSSVYSEAMPYSGNSLMPRGGGFKANQAGSAAERLHRAQQRTPWDRAVLESGDVTLYPPLQDVYSPQEDGDDDSYGSGANGHDEDGLGGIGGGRGGGSFFSVPAYLHGKFVGIVCGRVEMVPLHGVVHGDTLDDVLFKLGTWHDVSKRMHFDHTLHATSATSKGAATVAQQAANSSAVVTRSRGNTGRQFSTEPHASMMGGGGLKPRLVREQQHFSAAPIQNDGSGVGQDDALKFGDLQIDSKYFGSSKEADGGGATVGFAADSNDNTFGGPAHGPLGTETLVINFNAKRQKVLDKERKTQVLQFVKSAATELSSRGSTSSRLTVSDLGDDDDDDNDDDDGDDDEGTESDASGSSSNASKVGSAAWQLEHPVWIEGGIARVADGRRLRVVDEKDDDDHDVDDDQEGGSQLDPAAESSNTRRLPLPPLACCVTGQLFGSDGSEDFVCLRRPSMGANNQLFDFYSRAGFLKHYGDRVDAGTLQPLKEHGHFVTALGGLKFKTENFRCAHSGVELFGVPFYERGGRSYCEAAFLELFHSCPGCLEPVALDDPEKVNALGSVWHAQHLVCVSCVANSTTTTTTTVGEAADGVGAGPNAAAATDALGAGAPTPPLTGGGSSLLGQQCFAHDASDGQGVQPYCETCYVTNFCPQCGGCGEPINSAIEDVLEASGAYWHVNHFRCVDTGEPLVGDYFTVEGLPYSPEAFYRLFGKRCATCCETITGEARVEALDQTWHPECFICSHTGLPLADLTPSSRRASSSLSSSSSSAVPSAATQNNNTSSSASGGISYEFWEHEGRPYSRGAYFERFGDRCYFCEEPCVEDQRVTTPLVPVDSDDNDSNSGNGSSGSDVVEVRRVYHPECLHCVASGHPLGGSIAGESSDDVPEVFFGDDDGLPYSEDAYVSQFRACSALSGRFFTEGEEIFFSNGLPLGKEDLTEVFHEHWCAGCGDAITSGKMQVTPTVGNFKWHPTCLANYQANAAAAAPAGSQSGNAPPQLTPLVAANGATAAGVGIDPFETDRKRCARTEAAKTKFATAVEHRLVQRKAVLAAAQAKAKTVRAAAKNAKAALEQKAQQLAQSGTLQEQQQQQHTQQTSGPTPGGVQEASAHLNSTAAVNGTLEDASLDALLPAPPAPSSQQPPPPSAPSPSQRRQSSGLGGATMPAIHENQASASVERSISTGSSSSSGSGSKSAKPARQLSTSSCRGNLEKQGGGSSMFGSKSWKNRWFVLEAGGTLQYYASESDWVSGHAPLKDALYQMKACTASIDGAGSTASSSTTFKQDEFGIIIQPRTAQGGPRRMLLRAPANIERERWMAAFAAYAKPSKGNA